MSRLRLAALSSLVLFALGSSPALAQLPIRVEIDSLFFDQPQGNSLVVPVVVTLENLTGDTFEGALVLRGETGMAAGTRATRSISLAPHETREVALTLPNGNSYYWVANFRLGDAHGRSLGESRINLNTRYGGAGHDVVVLSEGAALRASVLELDTSASGGYQVLVGSVRRNARSGDFLAPTDAMPWLAATEIVAEGPELELLSPDQQRALIQAVRMGARLVVLPRAPEDIQRPVLRTLLGPARWTHDWPADRLPPPRTPAHSFGGLASDASGAPTEPRPLFLVGAGERPRVAPLGYGGSARLGFGQVWVASFPASAEALAGGDLRELLSEVFDEPRVPGEDSPLLFPSPQPPMLDAGRTMFADYLDPNQTFGPALGLVGVLLFFYVVVVGPLNFRFIERKNRPVLALVTTPIIALVFFLVLMGIGFAGKGVKMRARSIALLDAVEGEDVGVEIGRFTTFLTRPASFEIDTPRDGVLQLQTAGGASRAEISFDSNPPTLRELRGGLWDTLYFARMRPQELGGRVEFLRDAHGTVVRVRNESAWPLTNATLHVPDRGLVSLGEIAPGAEVAVDYTTLGTASGFPSNELATALYGMGAPEQPTVASMLGESYGYAYGPTVPLALYATIPAEAERVAGIFESERALRMLRIVARPAPDLLARSQGKPGMLGALGGIDPDDPRILEAFGPAPAQEEAPPPVSPPVHPAPAPTMTPTMAPTVTPTVTPTMTPTMALEANP